MKTMTTKDIFEQLMSGGDNKDFDITFTPEIVKALIWYGESLNVTAFGDTVSAHLKGQRLRAEACRYHKVARKVLGRTDYPDVLYNPDYGKYEEIGEWDFEV